MFCPGCGLEDKQSNQFCRACGADLLFVRNALAKPDSVTSSAVTARDEIGRAVAAKIREMDSAHDLKKVAEDVLPEIEKLLESPEEKRLRRLRKGTIISSIGFAAALVFSLAALIAGDEGIFALAGLGLVTFFIGLSFLINAMFFSIPKKGLPRDKFSHAENQRELDAAASQTAKLNLPESNQVFTSVTEQTTQHLKEKQPMISR